MSKRLRVLVVEDSRPVRLHLKFCLEQAGDFDLLEPAEDGLAAVQRAVAEHPDVILMDLELPRLSGLEALRVIMTRQPCPVIVLSAQVGSEDCTNTFDALRSGAVDVLPKPQGIEAGVMNAFATMLADRIRLMAQVKVVRRRFSTPGRVAQLDAPAEMADRPSGVVIGSSTGGPAVLWALLSRLPAPFPLPVIVSQHIGPGFVAGMCTWLSKSGHDVRTAKAGERPTAGVVHVSPADAHLVLADEHTLALEPVGDAHHVPNVDLLFHSAARAWGPRTIALLLTGMGRDGADGMRAILDAGGLTVAQEGKSCVVNGMPAAAIEDGAARQVLTPAEMITLLTGVAARSRDAK